MLMSRTNEHQAKTQCPAGSKTTGMSMVLLLTTLLLHSPHSKTLPKDVKAKSSHLPDQVDVFIQLALQEVVPEARIDLDLLISTSGLLIQQLAGFRIRRYVLVPMQDEHWESHLQTTDPPKLVSGYFSTVSLCCNTL